MKGKAGFTLIELLVVVALIGTLASLLIPNAATALQKARQKGTMKDIASLSRALADYVTDKGRAPAHSGKLTVRDALYTALSAFYMKAVPRHDAWGNVLYVYGQTSVNRCWGTYISGAGIEDFVVGSIGRDKTKSNVSFNPSRPTTAFFTITGVASFNTDLVVWNGWWVSAPRSAR